MSSLLVRLDSTKAVTWKSRPFEIATDAGISATSSVERVASIALRPFVLPDAAEENWQFSRGTFLVVQRSVSEETHAWCESAALEALEALVEAYPGKEMSFFCNTVNQQGSSHSASANAFSTFARCWAVVAKICNQIASFLESFVSVLGKDGGPVSPLSVPRISGARAEIG